MASRDVRSAQNDIAHLDGRSARAERTRAAVVDAMLRLMDEGRLRPTAREVAERAGVSLRSVFQHFEDLETLFAAAADRQIERMEMARLEFPAGTGLDRRLDRFVAERTRLLEAISPVRRAALLQAPFSQEISRRLGWVHEMLRRDVERAFAPELERLTAAECDELITALNVASEWYTWETLRRQDGLPREAAASVMRRMLRAMLKEAE